MINICCYKNLLCSNKYLFPILYLSLHQYTLLCDTVVSPTRGRINIFLHPIDVALVNEVWANVMVCHPQLSKMYHVFLLTFLGASILLHEKELVTTVLVADALSACAPQGTHITRVIPVNLQTCEPENKLLFQPLILGWLLHRINVAVNDWCYPFTHVSRKGDIKIGNGFRLRAMTECEAQVMITFGRIFRPKLQNSEFIL